MKRLIPILALVVIVTDLALKLIELGAERALIPGVLGLQYTSNTGAAFGMLASQPVLLTMLTAVFILLGANWLRLQEFSRFEEVCFGLMLGGAVGNLLDRLIHGAVSDYLAFLFMRFALFNLADACLVVGAVLLLAHSLFVRGGEKAA